MSWDMKQKQSRECYKDDPVVLKNVFNCFLSPRPPGAPGGGPDYHLPEKICRFGADSGPDPGVNYICFFIFGYEAKLG